jgi:CheY-like chemotaxis protein
VAEDKPVNAKVIEALLGQLGLAMTLAQDGQQAVDEVCQAVAGKLPDLMLMDLHMPVLDGYGATERIRQWEANHKRPHLPIIALTADAFEEDRQHCLAVGMDDFLTQPIAMEVLRSTLEKWLLHARASRTETPASMAVKPLDAFAFATLMDELTPLLQYNKFATISAFNQLQALVADTVIADKIEALAPLLREIRFDLVLPRLFEIAHKSKPRELL